MSIAQVLELGRDLFTTALLLALPVLAASLLVGLIVSILQTITSIQEQTLSFVPRMLAVALVLALTLPWALQIAVGFTVRMLWQAAEVTQ
jgi:flagellar biosynthetic protein FliQ